MDISWDDVRLFATVAETGSFSAAARALGIGQATASRRTARLEENLGYPLFTRSIDGVELTGPGRTVLAAARTMQDGALAFESAAKNKADELLGRVRFTSAPGVVVDLLAPFAAVLRKKHPRILLEALGDVAHRDLARGEADLALRTKEPRDPELKELARGYAKLGVYGSRSYAKCLKDRCDLNDLDWVGWAPPRDGLPPENWIASHVADYKPVFVADSFVALQRAAAAGVGVILLPDMQAKLHKDLVRIPLRPTCKKELPSAPIYLVSARSIWRSPRVQAVALCFLDWLDGLSTMRLKRSPDL